MRLVVNQKERIIESDSATLIDLVEGQVAARKSVAIAVNGEIVQRADWPIPQTERRR